MDTKSRSRIPKWLRPVMDAETMFGTALVIECLFVVVATSLFNVVGLSFLCIVCILRLRELDPEADEISRVRIVSLNEKLWIAYGITPVPHFFIFMWVNGMGPMVIFMILFVAARLLLALAGLHVTNTFYKTPKPNAYPRATRSRTKVQKIK